MKDVKSIYEFIDKIDFNIEDYEKEMLSDMEKQKLKKSLRINTKKGLNFKKIALITASITFSFIILSYTNLGKSVYAFAQSKVSEMYYSIGKALGFTKNIEKYTNKIDMIAENKGIEVKLNDVIIDNDILIFSTIYNTPQPTHDAYFKNMKVYINGEEINQLGGINNYDSDDTNTLFYSLSYYEFEGISQIDDLNIKLVLEDLEYSTDEATRKVTEESINLITTDEATDKAKKVIKGLWEFEFTANGKELALVTKTVPIDYTFEIDNQIFKLSKLEYNPVRQTIIGKREVVGEYNQSYFIQLRGKDNLGNQIAFLINSATDDKVVFSYNKVYGLLEEDWSDEITSITLAPFEVISGEQLGEEFTIDLIKN